MKKKKTNKINRHIQTITSNSNSNSKSSIAISLIERVWTYVYVCVCHVLDNFIYVLLLLLLLLHYIDFYRFGLKSTHSSNHNHYPSIWLCLKKKASDFQKCLNIFALMRFH